MATTSICLFIRSTEETKIRQKSVQFLTKGAKSKYGPSLNEVLKTGPNLNPDLLSTTIRFRMNRYAWTAHREGVPEHRPTSN
jgi:hypothetical protein